LFLTNPLV